MSQATGLQDYRHEADGIGMKTDPKTTAGRAFVRSLNILLKYARLYGYDHGRTAEQLEVAWKELRVAIPEGSDSGLLLGATGAQLLLDGVPLEGSPTEKQFAQLLSTAGLASVQFTPEVTEEELGKLMHAFPTGKAKPSELAQQLKEAIAGTSGIRVNEICFVATDSRLKDASMAAQIAAASMGDDQAQFTRMLNDPQKLLELIAAAEGSETGAGPGEGPGGGPGEGPGAGPGAGPGSGSGSGGTANGTGNVPGNGRMGAGGGAGTGTGSGTGSGIGGGTGVVMGAAGSGTIGGGGLGGGIGAGGGFGAGKGVGRGEGAGHGTGIPDDEEVYRILQALTTFGKLGTGENPAGAVVEFQTQVSQLPVGAQDTLRQALAGIAEQGKGKKLDQAMLVRLAEHLSIRFAMERFSRGEVKVNAVRQMLDRMNQEIEGLRKILGQHEDKMAEAGILVE